MNEALERARAAAAEARGEPEKLGLQNTPGITKTFEQSKQATQPLEEPTPGPRPTPTSYAKTLDEGYQPPAERSIGPDANQQQGEGSGMVESEQPKPELKPKSPEREAVDAKQFNQDWMKEQQRAAEALEQARAAAAEVKETESQAGQDRGNDQSMSMG